jgi:hypothetical protein
VQRCFIVLAVTALAAAACSGGRHASNGGRANPDRTAHAGRPSPDPYTASLRYANCMREHGVPHPRPDSKGDFYLTLADERRIRRIPEKKRKAADDACFHHLKGLNLSPLSKNAIARANKVVASLGPCIRRSGYPAGAPDVKNLGRGRASFGFKPTRANYDRRNDRRYWQRYTQVMHRCEQQVHLAKRLTKIIEEDRKETVDDNL